MYAGYAALFVATLLVVLCPRLCCSLSQARQFVHPWIGRGNKGAACHLFLRLVVHAACSCFGDLCHVVAFALPLYVLLAVW